MPEELYTGEEQQIPPPERPRDDQGRFISNDPPAPAPSPLKAEPAIPPYLSQQAEQLGFTPDEISSMTPGALHVAINRELRYRLQAQAELASFRDRDRPAPKPIQEVPQEEFGVNLREADGYDPAVINEFKKMRQEHAQEIAQLRSQNEQISQKHQAIEKRMVFNLLDECFATVSATSPEHETCFGSGAYNEITPEQFARRVAAMNQAQVQADKATEIPKRQLISKIKEAHKVLYGFSAAPAKAESDPYVQAQRQSQTQGNGAKKFNEKEWNDGATMTPTQRKEVNLPKGEKRAIERLQRKIDDLQSEDEEILGTLLPEGIN